MSELKPCPFKDALSVESEQLKIDKENQRKAFADFRNMHCIFVDKQAKEIAELKELVAELENGKKEWESLAKELTQKFETWTKIHTQSDKAYMKQINILEADNQRMREAIDYAMGVIEKLCLPENHIEDEHYGEYQVIAEAHFKLKDALQGGE